MHKLHMLRASFLCAITLFAVSCGSAQMGTLQSASELPLVGPSDPAREAFPGLPGLPAGEQDSSGPTKVVMADNMLPGSYYFSKFGSATENGTTLELFSSGVPDPTWGIWRWSGFTGGLKPLDLTIDWNVPAGDEVYVMLSDYTNGMWEMHGPMDGTQTNFVYDLATSYISGGGNTYVAIICANGDQITVNSLNVTADQDITGPCKPDNLHTTNITVSNISLAWDACTEPDTAGYNTYMLTGGTAYDFLPTDAGVQKLNGAPRVNPVFNKSGLTPGQFYHFRVEAVDSAGNVGPLSNVLTVQTTPDAPPGSPTDLHTTKIGGTSATLAWSAPIDLDIKGYNVYRGPVVDFDIAQGTKVNTSLLAGTSYVATGLNMLTQYHFRCVAVDMLDQVSVPSNTCTFSTVSNQPPEPIFTVSPDYITAGALVLFNPLGSTDDTTPMAQCIGSWDFEDDGSFDFVGTGEEIGEHTYPGTGTFTVRFRLEDGDGDFADYTQDITLFGQVSSSNLGVGKGYAATVLAAATDASTQRLGAMVDAGPYTLLYLYNGSSWSQVDATAQIGSDSVIDIAFAPGGLVGVLHADYNTGSKLITWRISEYNGSSWSSAGSQTVSNALAFTSGALAYSMSNGRHSVGLNYALDPGAPVGTIWDLNVWHETAASYNSVQFNNNFNQPSAIDMVRTDTNSYPVFIGNDGGTQIKVGSITDGGNSSTTEQTASGRVSSILCQQNPSNGAQVFWTAVTGASIFWGDNYGSANGGAQSFATGHSAVNSLLGMKYTADNQCMFYWADQDGDRVDYLRARNSGTSTTYELANGVGLAKGGVGGYSNDGSTNGVSLLFTEDRDGTASHRFYDDNTLGANEEFHIPANIASYAGNAAVVVFGEDSVTAMIGHQHPDALRADATSAEDSFFIQDSGTDAWFSPISACFEGTAGFALVVSTTDDQGLAVCKLDQGSNAVTESINLGPVPSRAAQIAYSPVSAKACLVYVSGTSVLTRTYNGSWSGPSTIYTGSAVSNVGVAARADGEFGCAFYTETFSLRISESTGSGASWGAASEISTAMLSPSAGVGISYDGSNQCTLAVERDVTNPGIWIGTKPNGGATSWAQANTTFGSQAAGIRTFTRNGRREAIYYKTTGNNLSIAGRMIRVYDDAGTWKWVELPLLLHGVPFGAAVDSAGNLILAGVNASVSPNPYPGVVAVVRPD